MWYRAKRKTLQTIVNIQRSIISTTYTALNTKESQLYIVEGQSLKTHKIKRWRFIHLSLLSLVSFICYCRFKCRNFEFFHLSSLLYCTRNWTWYWHIDLTCSKLSHHNAFLCVDLFWVDKHTKSLSCSFHLHRGAWWRRYLHADVFCQPTSIVNTSDLLESKWIRSYIFTVTETLFDKKKWSHPSEFGNLWYIGSSVWLMLDLLHWFREAGSAEAFKKKLETHFFLFA